MRIVLQQAYEDDYFTPGKLYKLKEKYKAGGDYLRFTTDPWDHPDSGVLVSSDSIFMFIKHELEEQYGSHEFFYFLTENGIIVGWWNQYAYDAFEPAKT